MPTGWKIPTMPNDDNPVPFDCTACGACCQTMLWAVRVEPDDRTPRHLTRSVRRRMGFASWEADDGVRCMHSVGDRCAALRGEVGLGVRCACYDRRPLACSDFAPGSMECLQARRSLADLVTQNAT